MKGRFEGANQPQLIDALRRQEFSCGSLEVAQALATGGTLVEFSPNETMITQAESDNDVYFLIAGAVGIIVNGAQIGTRRVGQHVGEMAALEPSLTRSATVVTLEQTVALKLSSADFMSIGNRFPQCWLPLARELARRLHQRNSTIWVPNESPRVFIISSSEALTIAHELQAQLEHDASIAVWDKGVFFAGDYLLEALEAQVAEADFAVAIAQPDDFVLSRGAQSPTLRDNVLFEFGLFMGTLTRQRAILVHPKVENLKLPSDLHGLTFIPYEPDTGIALTTRLKKVSDHIRAIVTMRGVRRFSFEENRKSGK